LVSAVWNSHHINLFPRWEVYYSMCHFICSLFPQVCFCNEELSLHQLSLFLSVKIVISESPGLCKPSASPGSLFLMEVNNRNWHKALPAVEPGVTHSNTAITFTQLLCSSGHNSLTHSPWLSFVFRCPSCPLLHTPKHDSFYLSLPCSFFISPFCLNLFQDKVLSLI